MLFGNIHIDRNNSSSDVTSTNQAAIAASTTSTFTNTMMRPVSAYESAASVLLRKKAPGINFVLMSQRKELFNVSGLVG